MRSLHTTVALPLDQADAAIRAALAEQGFGILTEIDLAQTLKDKLGIDRAPLKILGACNPHLAHEAVEHDPSIALMLPCNVTLRPSEDGSTRIDIADPRELMPDARFASIAQDAATTLQAALDSLG